MVSRYAHLAEAVDDRKPRYLRAQLAGHDSTGYTKGRVGVAMSVDSSRRIAAVFFDLGGVWLQDGDFTARSEWAQLHGLTGDELGEMSRSYRFRLGRRQDRGGDPP